MYSAYSDLDDDRSDQYTDHYKQVRERVHERSKHVDAHVVVVFCFVLMPIFLEFLVFGSSCGFNPIFWASTDQMSMRVFALVQYQAFPAKENGVSWEARFLWKSGNKYKYEYT